MEPFLGEWLAEEWGGFGFDSSLFHVRNGISSLEPWLHIQGQGTSRVRERCPVMDTCPRFRCMWYCSAPRIIASY
jgi:hypothetical protein